MSCFHGKFTTTLMFTTTSPFGDVEGVNALEWLMHEVGTKQLLLINTPINAPPSSLCDPKKVQKVGFAELVRNLVPLPASSTKRGRGVVLEAPGLD
jgi:hypothetical protein